MSMVQGRKSMLKSRILSFIVALVEEVVGPYLGRGTFAEHLQLVKNVEFDKNNLKIDK